MFVLALLVATQPVSGPWFPPPRPYPPELQAKLQEAARTRVRATQQPKILYLNFDGGVLYGGMCSDAPTNCSNIVAKTMTNYPAFNGTAQQKQQIIDLVKGYYAPFNVQIVLQRPASGDYAMVMVGGTSADVGDPIPGAVGVGPLDCGEMNPNDITFAWSADQYVRNDPLTVAETIGQEAAHAYGLGHTNNMADVMYPAVTDQTTGFLNMNMRIYDLPGSGSSDCTGTGTQNSYQFLINNVGSATPDTVPPTISLTSPHDGDTLPSAFTVTFDASDDRVMDSVELFANDQSIGKASKVPYTFNVPAGTIPAGMVVLRGVARDKAGNATTSAMITVHVKALGQTPGDLGTSCTDTSQCNGGGYCAMVDTTHSVCTRDCSPSNACPTGFQCVQTPTFTSMCQLVKTDDGGCTTLPGSRRDLAPTALLLALAAFALMLSRRS